jgi:hypothetical protein
MDTEDLTTAYMLGKYDGRKESQAANSRCSASAGSEYSLLGLLADIREAVGDPHGRLMQNELVGHCKTLRVIGDMMARMLETAPTAPIEEWPDDQEIMETVESWRKLFQNTK